jgi:hypothetical protein
LSTRALKPLTLALLALAAFSGVAAADYKDAYKQGVEAVEKSKWADAARLMQEAIAAKSAEGETIRFYGQRFEPYLPHFYLGLALFNSGDCVGALRSWATSESQGAVRKSEQYRTLTKNRGACEAKATSPPKPTPATPPPGPEPAAVAQATQAAEAALKRADDAARAVAALQGDPMLGPVWSQDAALGPAQERAKEGLATARTKLDTGRKKPDLAQLAEAREAADRVAQQLEGLSSHATRRRTEIASASKPTPGPAPATPTATATKAPTPPELLAGARAFFGAQYPQTVALLAGADSLPGRAGAQGLMLRAAARHALYLIGGERDTGLLSSAQADARASRRLDPQGVPDPQAFSPRFVELFRQSR